MLDKKAGMAGGGFLLRAHHKGQLTQLSISDISKHTRLSRPTVHQVLAEFESFGMLTYQQSSTDNRFKHVVLTEQFMSEVKKRFAVFNSAALAASIAAAPITPPDPIRASTRADPAKP
jgi:DNA-binding MarR family transcriptional regulator